VSRRQVDDPARIQPRAPDQSRARAPGDDRSGRLRPVARQSSERLAERKYTINRSAWVLGLQQPYTNKKPPASQPRALHFTSHLPFSC
jgi:hypothetical protein